MIHTNEGLGSLLMGIYNCCLGVLKIFKRSIRSKTPLTKTRATYNNV